MDNIEKYREFKPELSAFFASDLTSGTRRPYFDVGEFLPKLNEGEIEFARINLSSTTGDVFSLRIRRDKNKFIVRVVDEYETEFIDFKSEYDSIPNQGEIINVITSMNNEEDSQPYWLAIIEQNEFETIDEITDFIQVDSNLYPHLNELFSSYLIENGFHNESNEDMDDVNLELISELIKNHKKKSDWESLMGTICFNVWNKTNRWFLNSNDIRFIDISFICALNLFQKWDHVYLADKFSFREIAKDASPFVVLESNKILDNTSKLKAFISAIKDTGFGEKETSKHFISLFAADLLSSSKFNDESINPLEYFQTGVEILCLYVLSLKEQDDNFYHELLDIGDLETLSQEIIDDINYLNESEI